MESINEILEKYSDSVIRNIDENNFKKIIEFLNNEKCDYIDDLVNDYLDLFTFEYDDFVQKYNKLNEKYDNDFLNKASEDMNLFEEFYKI